MRSRGSRWLGTVGAFFVAVATAGAGDLAWIRTARTFLVDAYQPPFAPEFEYDAEALVRTMVEMHANSVRIATMGKYATIPGVRFSPFPALARRDVLAETIAAAKPRGIRVVPYISTGHKLAWSMVTRDYPEYAQRTRPGGGPHRDHMFVGEDHGTVCWNTPYRRAFLDLVERVVRDYDVDGLYFDTWRPFYFWPEPRLCYCDGCRSGFEQASGGKKIPWRERRADYSAEELRTIAEYHRWYRERLVGTLEETRRIVKSHKDIPLIYNVNNPRGLADEDPRVLKALDAFLYERGNSLLERAEGVSLARAAGLGVWPYVGVYNNWPRVVPNGLDYQQEIFAAVAFGGAPIVAQPYGYVADPTNRRWVSFPFSVFARRENELAGFENVPYAAVVYADRSPPDRAATFGLWPADARASSLGAFAACLYGHVQVASIPELVLDQPGRLARYRVLYLADVPHLVPQRIRHLRDFVENGGGLLVSGATSLYDSAGQRLERFALEDLLRVRPARGDAALAQTLESYRCMIGGPNDLYLLPRASSSSASRPMIPLWRFEPVELLEGGTASADIVAGDGRRPILPGVVTSRHGKGRVVYLASSLESLYGSTRQALLGTFLRRLVEDAAGGPPPCRIDAPSSVIANLAENGNRRVLHLLNWTGDAENESNYLPPVENVAVRMTVPDGWSVHRTSTFLDASLSSRRSGRELELLLPRLESYQAIVVEFAPGVSP